MRQGSTSVFIDRIGSLNQFIECHPDKVDESETTLERHSERDVTASLGHGYKAVTYHR